MKLDKIKTQNKYLNSEKGFVNEVINGIFMRAKKNNNRKKWIPECKKQDIYSELMLYIRRLNGKRRTRAPITETNFSIDRLDSTKTYKIPNLVFCCAGCNNRKNQVKLSDVVNITRVWMKRATA